MTTVHVSSQQHPNAAQLHHGSGKVSPDAGGRWQQAASPTTGQQTFTQTPKPTPSHHQHDDNEGTKSSRVDSKTPENNEQETWGSSSVSPALGDLYPLTGLLNALLTQEKILWERNEILLKSLKRGTVATEGASMPDFEAPSDRASVITGSTTFSGTSSHTKLHYDDPEDSSNTGGLYFIRYGQLTNTIHKFFRKLEKRHACLHLTARRAKHETLHHVERTGSGEHPEEPPTVPHVPVHTPRASTQVVILRDEELLVYRCALMCSQFPMLSAPSPPEGKSPTPRPPSLPSVFATGTLSSLEFSGKYQRTTEDRSLHYNEHPLNIGGFEVTENKGRAGESSMSSISSPTSTDPRSLDSVDGGRAQRPNTKRLSEESKGAAVSEPIHIKGTKTRTKSKSIKRHSSILDGADIAKLPPGDSDEEAELVMLTTAKMSSSMSESSPVGREHPFSPMVNREMLYCLVRQAFQQTEEQRINFEASLKHEYGRRSKGEILAKELAGQLQVLENNAHPFYKPKLFVTRNGYDLWLQGEKERVRKLIDKFWHCSLPRPQLWRNYNPINYHEAYNILLRKIIDAESRTDRKEPVHSGKTPSSSLSPTAQRLLTEFGLRYGVGELYRRIVYLDYLAKHFDYEIWYIKHCTEELRSIRNLLPRNRNRITAVRPEMEILRATIHLLHGQTDNSLTRIDRLFLDSDPRKGVASLIELLAEVLDAEQTLFGKRVRPVEDWLKKYLKNGFSLRYMRRKEIASDETVESRTVQPFVLTPTLVNSLLLGTRDEVYEFREKYQSVFRPYFDVVPFSKVEFYKLICSDACSLCARAVRSEETRKILSLEMLGLMYRLNERDIEWQGVIDPELQQWRQRFLSLASIWMDVLNIQIEKWTIAAVKEDQWTLLAFDSTSQSSTSPTHSAVHSMPSDSWQRGPTNPYILSSIRISPFPSPPVPEGPLYHKSVLGNGPGAFMPYRHVIKHPQKSSPISSESSGAVDETPPNCRSPLMDTSSSMSIADGLRLFPDARKQKTPDSLVTFAQKGTVTGGGRGGRLSDDLVLPSHEVEVSISVYGSDDDQEGRLASFSESPENTMIPPMDTVDSTLIQVHPGGVAYQQGGGAGPPLQHSVATLETSTASDRTLVAEDSRTSNASHEVENGLTGQLVQADATGNGAVPNNGGSVSQSSSLASPKFNNLLDKCNSEESDVVRPKPQVIQAPSAIRPHLGSKQNSEDSDVVRPKPQVIHAPSAMRPHLGNKQNSKDSDVVRPKPQVIHAPSVVKPHPTTTAKSWHDDHTHLADNTSTATSTLSVKSPSSPEITPSPSEGYREGGGGVIQSYLFPVSNSPMDIVTMLSRLASFTGELLRVLTPKISKTRTDKSLPVEEYAPEVTKARNQASERQKNARNIKSLFLKKLNKAMISSLKLYADNLLCMDLCCWPSSEASVLLGGDQMLSHLNRRKECGEIWGCRHNVEAKHGLHPNGIPCNHQKSSEKFECITRDMCIRINNIHVLITIFHSLEDHLYSLVRTDTTRSISAFGYVSSDHSEQARTPVANLLNSKTNKPHPCRTHLKSEDSLNPPTEHQKDTSSWPSSISTGLGPMEPDQALKKKAGDEQDTLPRQSLECLEYLKNVQRFQLKMIAKRMNKFCKYALSELLRLKLGDCPIEKRLVPMVDYLDRHRMALQKYVYPDCFSAIMKFMWECLLQDLEDEALKLRSSKRPVTDRAQLLLQALAHLIQFMHNRNNGLDIDLLNSSSEYLQGLLDVMTRSTDQLIKIYNRLNTPHFTHNVLDLNRAPVAVDMEVLHQLHSHMRSDKKSFTGKEFTSKVIEVGRGTLAETMDCDVARESPRVAQNSHILQGPMGQLIEYNEEYASAIGQYLLDERILIGVPSMLSLSSGSSILITPDQNTDEEDGVQSANHLASSFDEKDMTDSMRPQNSAISFISGVSDLTTSTAADSPGQVPRNAANRRRTHSSVSQDKHTPRRYYHQQGREAEQLDKPSFFATSDVFYKFTSSEDAEFALLHSQILMASTVNSPLPSLSSSGHSLSAGSATSRRSKQHSSGRHEERQDFNAAKEGTLCLVYDLLCQRARKERVAKQFLNSPSVQEQRRHTASEKCDLIFKM